MSLILIIDDSKFQRNQIARFVQTQGHELLMASNGLEGLETLRSTVPDLIFVDLLMPKMDGISFIKEARAAGFNTPIVVLTADIQDTQKTACFDAGATDFINKPPTRNKCAAILSDLLGNKENSTSHPASLPKTTETMEFKLDAMREAINIGTGRAASILNEMLECHIELSVPKIEFMDNDSLQAYVHSLEGNRYSCISQGYSGLFTGVSSLIFPLDSAATLVYLLTDEVATSPDFNEIKSSTLLEVGNIVINSVMGSLANRGKGTIDYSLPFYEEKDAANIFTTPVADEELVHILATTNFLIKEHNISGDMAFILKLSSFNLLAEKLSTLCPLESENA